MEEEVPGEDGRRGTKTSLDGLEATQLAWHTGHLGLFERCGGVPLWVQTHNLKTGVAQGMGPTAVLYGSYEAFARVRGFWVDPCQPAMGSDNWKVGRGVRPFREAYGPLLRPCWSTRGSVHFPTGAIVEDQTVGEPRNGHPCADQAG
jgi:hypothetical protein